MGVVSSQPEHGHTPAARLLTPDRFVGAHPPPTFPAVPCMGRLDLDSSGLLLLGSDPLLARAVIGSNLPKVYEVQTSRPLNSKAARLMHHGLELDGRKLLPIHVQQDGVHLTLELR